MTSQALVVGVDLGGTKISTALVDVNGQIIAHDYRETQADKGQAVVIDRMLDAVRQVMEQADIPKAQVRAVGIGAPGPLDIHAGVVIAPPNLPGWRDVPLKELIEERVGIKTFLENDANAAALAEHRFGAGQGCDHVIYVTVSTGVGGGLILDGKLYHGAEGAAGEVGHITILPNGPLCGCGNRGCLEALASGTAIAKRAREVVSRGAPTVIAELADGDPERITAKLVAEAAEQGDFEARKILSEAMNYLGIGIASLVNLFNPQVIVIGGGLSNLGERLLEPVRRGVARHAFAAPARTVQVVLAELGDKSGVLGAAAAALTQIEREISFKIS
ncbi:MAG TPA: ROK family protein [Chloroflexi bacterium]|nr:ROK family protein [Chloroflexota bacterium]